MMELSSGLVFGFPARAIPALAQASPTELATVRLSAGGGALRWETLDADLSVPGLLLASVDRPARLRELALGRSDAEHGEGGCGARQRSQGRPSAP